MSWPMLLTASVFGLIASGVAVVLTILKGREWDRYLPKKGVHESLEALKESQEKLILEKEALQGDLFEARADIEAAKEGREWIKRNEERIGELEDRKKELEDTERSLVQQMDELAKAESGVVDCKATAADLEVQIDKQRMELLPMAELEEQKALESELLERVNSLEARKVVLEPTVEKLKDDEARLLDSVAELRREESVLTNTVAGLQARRDSLENRLDDLKEMQLHFKGGTEETTQGESTKLLWDSALKGQRLLTPSADSEEVALERTTEYIKQSGLVFDPRVIRAFHTSLKCADESPLLVLAGISGTGKSALPVAYAEAMGINSLIVPVQPGWDSPADLLGFYNHLESRFRPTELARALIQMDYCHQPKDAMLALSGAEWPQAASERKDLSSQMLLVLLDEMNLARVEYYFSEFLSRLELRSGFDPKTDHEKRARAELVFDLGSSGEGKSHTLSTFVGRNVLFVGTMNEDESTQTLSDKVIDRSNVMRFGKPNKLIGGGAGTAETPKVPTSFLSREEWGRWTKQDSSVNVEIEKWLDQLNTELGKIGRPFAHRVAKGIRAYVNLYPYSSAQGQVQGMKDAFADQIELRILPRLRGLDIHDAGVGEAIDSVVKLVENELNDDRLASAIRDARERAGYQLFHWNGVDRLGSNGLGSQRI